MASIEKRRNRFRVRWRDPDGRFRCRSCPTHRSAEELRLEVEEAAASGRRWTPHRAVSVPPLLSPMLESLYRIPMTSLCGVYFLVDAEEVVYVGQSVSVHGRVSDHIGDGVKRFDRALAIHVPPEDLDATENAFIRALKPRYNRRSTKPCDEDEQAILSRYGLVAKTVPCVSGADRVPAGGPHAKPSRA